MKKIIAILAVFIFSFCLAAVLKQSNNIYAEEAVIVECSLSEKYKLGDTVEIGQVYFSGGISSDGSMVYLPDGSATAEKEIVLSDYGRYAVKYYSKQSDRMLFGYKYFTVDTNLVTFGNNNSSAYYGYNEISGKTGVNISVARGDEATFNAVVNLSELSPDEPLIDFAFAPEKIGTPDAYRVYMKLTDIYDSDNYVIVRMQSWSDMGTWADPFIYMDVRGPQTEWTSSVEQNDNHHKRGENGKGWYIDQTSMCGRDSTGKREQSYVRFFFDYEELSMVTEHNHYGSQYLIDFDDPQWFDLNSETMWNGFTTGECLISFYSQSNTAAALNLTVIHIAGVDLQAETVSDSTPPALSIDFEGYSQDNLPRAVLGKRYRIFDATAYDNMDGDVDVITNVYFDYNGKRSIVSVKDGVFTPNKSGDYTIVYSASDKTGNKVIRTVDIGTSDIDLLEFSIEGKASSGIAGETLKAFNNISISSSNGNTVIFAIANHVDGKESIEFDGDSFIPSYSGKYEITVTVSDYTSERIETYEVRIFDSNVPLITGNVDIPAYMLLNASYNLPSLYANVYSGGKILSVETQIFVKENGGDERELTGSEYIPQTAGNATVIYRITRNGFTSERRYDTVIKDVGFGTSSLSLKDYFVSDSVNISATDVDMRFTANSNSQFHFINKVQAVNLDIKFDVEPTKNNFGRFSIILTDSVDKSVKVKLTYSNNGSNSGFYINDDSEQVKYIAANYIGNSKDLFMLKYNAINRYAFGSNTVYLTVKEDMSGRPFNGFPSDFVYVTFMFEGVSGTSEVILKSINNQSFYNVSRDRIKPEVNLVLSNGDKLPGEKVILNRAVFSDVLDPKVTARMSVTDPDGSYVIAECGTVLDESCDPNKSYVITATKIGDYTISYVVSDSRDNTFYYDYGFSVIDNIAPQITIGEHAEKANKGDTVKIASMISLTDNYSPADKISVYYYVKSPSSVITPAGESFTAGEAGIYTVYIYAFDENFNIAMVKYTVSVI